MKTYYAESVIIITKIKAVCTKQSANILEFEKIIIMSECSKLLHMIIVQLV